MFGSAVIFRLLTIYLIIQIGSTLSNIQFNKNLVSYRYDKELGISLNMEERRGAKLQSCLKMPEKKDVLKFKTHPCEDTSMTALHGKCYFWDVSTPGNKDAALAYCATVTGAEVFWPLDLPEDKFIQSVSIDNNIDIWMAVTNGAANAIPSNFVGRDGKPLAYSNWGGTQPDGAPNNEKCVCQFPSRDYWTDRPCGDNNKGFLCEIQDNAVAADVKQHIDNAVNLYNQELGIVLENVSFTSNEAEIEVLTDHSRLECVLDKPNMYVTVDCAPATDDGLIVILQLFGEALGFPAFGAFRRSINNVPSNLSKKDIVDVSRLIMNRKNTRSKTSLSPELCFDDVKMFFDKHGSTADCPLFRECKEDCFLAPDCKCICPSSSLCIRDGKQGYTKVEPEYKFPRMCDSNIIRGKNPGPMKNSLRSLVVKNNKEELCIVKFGIRNKNKRLMIKVYRHYVPEGNAFTMLQKTEKKGSEYKTTRYYCDNKSNKKPLAKQIVRQKDENMLLLFKLDGKGKDIKLRFKIRVTRPKKNSSDKS